MLDTSSTLDVKRLLELFPIANLRQAWPKLNGTKEEICTAIAEEKKHDDAITFIDENVSCCKQHVYIFSHGPEVTELPEAVPEGARVFEATGSHALYIVRSQYSVILKDPLEETSLDFLWPIRIELTPENLIVRFVVLEKNISSYFERSYYVGSRSVDEKTILQIEKLQLQRTDLHKGIKKLWDDGFMDSPRAKYKKPISMASEAMDEERGIKEYNPQLYETLQESVLLDTLFMIPEEKKCTVSVFSVDPSNGYLAFPRYSEKKGDTDRVIREILQNNQ